MPTSPYLSRPWSTAYAEGVPLDIEPPSQTLPEMLAASVDASRGKTALEFFGATTSYRELGDQVSRAAEGLRRLGVRAGDRVALVLPNCPQHIVAFYAALRLGAIVIEHNPLYTARELRHQFEDHGARHTIVWDKLADTVADFPSDLGIEHIVSVDLTAAFPLAKRLALRLPIAKARQARQQLTATPTTPRALRWGKLLTHGALSRTHPGPGLHDTALLQYTSGTTGSPKGAVLTHANLRANAMQGRAWVPGLGDDGETFYAVLPLFHVYGLTLCLTFGISIGAKLVLFPKYDLDMVVAAAKKSPPTFLPAVPPIYDQLARAAARGTLDLSSVRYALSGAMSLPVATVERWEAATGGLLVEGYGMTESSPIALANPVGPSRRPGTVGVPIPSTDIRVVDPEDPSRDLPLGEAGELLLRGPQVFQGYWNRSSDTAETLLPGGWLRTGDIVTVSPDGYVTIVDRLKEIIITGGFNVAPSEVEAVLTSHPDIESAAVVAMPKSRGGEDVAAAIVVRDGVDLAPDVVREYCKTRLADYKVPRRIVVVDDLPRSLIGKILRREVRERLMS